MWTSKQPSAGQKQGNIMNKIKKNIGDQVPLSRKVGNSGREVI